MIFCVLSHLKHKVILLLFMKLTVGKILDLTPCGTYSPRNETCFGKSDTHGIARSKSKQRTMSPDRFINRCRNGLLHAGFDPVRIVISYVKPKAPFDPLKMQQSQ